MFLESVRSYVTDPSKQAILESIGIEISEPVRAVDQFVQFLQQTKQALDFEAQKMHNIQKVDEECEKWEGMMIYDISKPMSNEGSVYLGNFEFCADLRNGLNYKCVMLKMIGTIINLVQEDHIQLSQWHKIRELCGRKIEYIHIGNIYDYKVSDDGTDTDLPNNLKQYRGAYVQRMENAVQRLIPLIDKKVARGENVLIHCIEGKSRSATIAIIWYMLKTHTSSAEALRFIKRLRPIVEPNSDFLEIIKSYDRMVEPESIESVLPIPNPVIMESPGPIPGPGSSIGYSDSHGDLRSDERPVGRPVGHNVAKPDLVDELGPMPVPKHNPGPVPDDLPMPLELSVPSIPQLDIEYDDMVGTDAGSIETESIQKDL